MPHSDAGRALEMALGLDIPFWPQLPNLSFHEDMYAQTAQGFPGIAIDLAEKRVDFDSERFEQELTSYSEEIGDPRYFTLTPEASTVYHRFLQADLGSYPAVRGQVTGPVSFGFRVVDERLRPVIYNDSVRTILFDFIQRKANVQYEQLRQKSENAFVWIDEPGLGWIFSAFSGYDDIQARSDYRRFLEGIEGAKALHLCANVNLPYLLGLGIELLSFDAYQIDTMPTAYASSVAEFLNGGGIISWGIVPTDSGGLDGETVQSLARRLEEYWKAVSQQGGITPRQVAEQSLLAPARCCLKNIGRVGAADEPSAPRAETAAGSIEERLVETAFALLKELSRALRDRFALG